MSPPLFDMALRQMRRDRAFRRGPPDFLFERTFSDVIDRLRDVRRPFSSALLIGCPLPSWRARLADLADQVTCADPGPLFADAVDGFQVTEDQYPLGPPRHDLCVAIGTLDTVNQLPLALANVRSALTADSLLIGAMSGGDTLPRLRAAMRAADQVSGAATPHVHPRVDAPNLCRLLTETGFLNAVVDVDRVQVAYQSLESLVTDLRSMAATNILTDRSKNGLTRSARTAAADHFLAEGRDGRTIEIFEILHFAAWTPPS